MNTAALIALIVALSGKTTETIPAGKLRVITDSVGTKSCQVNDAKCVARVVKDAQKAVKAHSKAVKAAKEDGDDLCQDIFAAVVTILRTLSVSVTTSKQPTHLSVCVLHV